MQIQRWLLTPAQFEAIPIAERSFFVLLAHIQNEINVLNKLLACSTRIEPGLNSHVHSGNCQSFILCRTLIGKLNEAWGAIQDGFFHSKLSISYDSLLQESAARALAELKTYFGKKNLIASVRNNFSFHYSIQQAGASVPNDTGPEELAIYVHKHVGNSLYQFAEFVMNKALLDSISPGDPAWAMDRMLSEMNFVVARMNEFGQGMMIAILDKFVGEDALHATAEQLELKHVPKLSEVRIPFFIEMPEPSSPRGDA